MHQLVRAPADLTLLTRHGDRRPVDVGPVLDFSVNTNPLGPPLSVLRAVRQSVPLLARYPDPDCTQLTRLIAARHDIDPAQVVVGNGSSELIMAVARTLAPGRAAIIEPTYTEYLRACVAVGSPVEHWLAATAFEPPTPFELPGVAVVWLGNPNNPTGFLWPADQLRDWIAANADVVFVLDEAFLPFRADDGTRSLAGSGRANVIVLRSLTKLYTIPGLRLGYLVTSAERATRIRAQLPPWSVNALAQAAGCAALDDHDFLFRTQLWRQAECDWTSERLASFGAYLEVFPSAANFLLCRLRDRSAAQLVTELLERRLMVRDASNFVGLAANAVRIALRTRRENHFLLSQLRAIMLGLPVEPLAEEST